SAWGKINATNSGTGAWVVVGTDKAAYFSHNAYSNSWLSFFAGDLKVLGENDQWPFVYSLTSSSSAYVFHSGMFMVQDRNFMAARAASGLPGGVELHHGTSTFAGYNRYGAGG